MGRKIPSNKSAPSWLEPLCRIPIDFVRQGTKSVRQLFIEVNPDLSDRAGFTDLVAERLGKDPALIEAWQNYSLGKRVDQGPYMEGTTVGYYVRGARLEKRKHPNYELACADFMFREARIVLHYEQPR